MFYHSAENKRKSKHAGKSLNPEWNQTVIYKNIHLEQVVCLLKYFWNAFNLVSFLHIVLVLGPWDSNMSYFNTGRSLPYFDLPSKFIPGTHLIICKVCACFDYYIFILTNPTPSPSTKLHQTTCILLSQSNYIFKTFFNFDILHLQNKL